jgi:hypothetical protein
MASKTFIFATAVTVSGLILSMNAIGAPVGQVPAAHKQGEISYVMGGVGQPEANAIKHAARRYPLELQFVLKAKPKDEFLSAVKVRINDAHEKTVLDVTADGPYLLAKMPAGKYTISAEHDGKVENRKVEIAAREHRRVVFEWQS